VFLLTYPYLLARYFFFRFQAFTGLCSRPDPRRLEQRREKLHRIGIVKPTSTSFIIVAVIEEAAIIAFYRGAK
jgi:hypothetical protein